MPPQTARNPDIKLTMTFMKPLMPLPVTRSRNVSYSNVENVVYAPTKPTAMPSRQCR
jgi:hypothetical protein